MQLSRWRPVQVVIISIVDVRIIPVVVVQIISGSIVVQIISGSIVGCLFLACTICSSLQYLALDLVRLWTTASLGVSLLSCMVSASSVVSISLMSRLKGGSS